LSSQLDEKLSLHSLQTAIYQFIKNCLSIQSIRLKKGLNISHKTVDGLIALALKRPKIYFDHSFYTTEDSSIILNDLKISQVFPNNITLNITYVKDYMDEIVTKKIFNKVPVEIVSKYLKTWPKIFF